MVGLPEAVSSSTNFASFTFNLVILLEHHLPPLSVITFYHFSPLHRIVELTTSYPFALQLTTFPFINTITKHHLLALLITSLPLNIISYYIASPLCNIIYHLFSSLY